MVNSGPDMFCFMADQKLIQNCRPATSGIFFKYFYITNSTSAAFVIKLVAEIILFQMEAELMTLRNPERLLGGILIFEKEHPEKGN